MQQIFHEIKINTKGQGLYDFTNKTVSWLEEKKIKRKGQHTAMQYHKKCNSFNF